MAKLTIEVADTPAALAHGLMYVKDLPENNGMLFKFPYITAARFWGKNTYIPLDVAFVGKDNIINSIKQIVPMSTRMVYSDDFCSMAIEANAGYFKKNEIEPGHKISVSGDSIEFKKC